MYKSFLILTPYALLLVFSQSLSPMKAEKISFIANEIQFNSKELKEDFLEIKIDVNCSNHNNMIVGYNGKFIFTTEYSNEKLDIFDPETIEQETSFSTIMTNENQETLKIKCRLWKQTNIIRIICDANFNVKGKHSVRIGTQPFEYKNHTINITFYEIFTFEQIDIYYPFLYSYAQTINIIESRPTIKLKFKFDTYYDEILYIYGAKDNYAVLDNCKKNGKELVCEISKEKLEEILISNKEEFELAAMSDTLGILYFTYVYPLTINYQNVQKEDIHIKFEKLVEGITELGAPFAFETNIKQIPNLISDKSNVIGNAISYFRKMAGRPLMLVINYSIRGDNIPAPSIINEVTLEDIH